MARIDARVDAERPRHRAHRPEPVSEEREERGRGDEDGDAHDRAERADVHGGETQTPAV